MGKKKTKEIKSSQEDSENTANKTKKTKKTKKKTSEAKNNLSKTSNAESSKKSKKKASKKSSKRSSKKTTKKTKKSTKNGDKIQKKTSKKTSKKKISEPENSDIISSNTLDLPLTPLDENLQKLLTDEEREKMEENLDLVVCYLEDIGIVDLKIDRKKLIIAVPFDYEDFTFLSHIVLSPEWILIKTSIFEIDKLSSNSTTHLYAEILKGNFILNSVVYSLDPENKSIWAQADVPISADFETFKLNYFSIVFAIDYFMKNISPKLQMQLKSTVEKDTFKNSENNLYI
ncbi:hypothetical protein [Candidatus Lokiarchaeum ossiferum]|uniref:hypothetical protein n=1 Tax=Candidatus Lokiarchaeum ossiferum TaxID=2951803 RepID=UPI00352C7BCB